MTSTTAVRQRGNGGDHRYVIAEIDITSLDSAGSEPLDPSTAFKLRGAYADAIDQEDYTLTFHFDAAGNQIIVKDASGADVTSGTDVGTVTLLFRGDWSA